MFTITSYSAFRRATRDSFLEAVLLADHYAREGGLPSTIVGEYGRWTKWAGAPVERQEGIGCPECGGNCDAYLALARSKP